MARAYQHLQPSLAAVMGEIRSFHVRREWGIEDTELCPTRMGFRHEPSGAAVPLLLSQLLPVPVLLSSAPMHFSCISAGAHSFCSVPLGTLLS